MFGSKGKEARREMEALLNEIQINLENNYKDLAIKAKAEAEQRLEQLKAGGGLSAKDTEKIEKRMAEYAGRMAGYKSQSGKVLK